MSAKLRCVFDTNTLVSALLFQDRSPGRALLHAFSLGDVLTNMDVIGELAEVLRREKFDRYVKKKLREDFLRTLIQKSLFMKSRIDPITLKTAVTGLLARSCFERLSTNGVSKLSPVG
jgi:uncharacterized protein